jgi:hypothetical protein
MKTIRIGAGERVILTDASWSEGRLARLAAQCGGFVAAVLLSSLLAMLTGCGGGPTGPDDPNSQTPAGIEVAGTVDFAAVDAAWNDVNRCWQATVPGTGVRVTAMQPEITDKNGKGVIRFQGALVYGARDGYSIYVATDLAALRHEFSHLVGELATGSSVDNGNGKCWI